MRKIWRENWLFFLFVVLCILVVLLVPTGCSKPPVSGHVVRHQHSDAVTYVSTYCAGYDSKMRCTHGGVSVNHIPAEWKVCVDCFEVGERRYHEYVDSDDWPGRGSNAAR